MNELGEISALIKEYISPETVWLVPCLYALGCIIKKSIRIDDTLIPSVLCLVGVLLSALVSVAACEPTGWIQVGDSGCGEHRAGLCAGGRGNLPQSAAQAAQQSRSAQKGI